MFKSRLSRFPVKMVNSALPVLLLYVSIIFACYPGLFLDFSTAVIRGDAGDLRNILGIVSHTISSPLNEVYQLPVFYPESFVLTKTHPLFGISLFFYLFKWLGLSLTRSVNLYVILSLAAGAWGTFLLAKEFVPRPFFPLLLSTLYILHPLNHIHFVWLNFLSRFYIPFVFFFFIRYLKTRKRSYAAAAVFFAFLQFLASVYYGVLLWAVMVPLFLLFALLLKRTPFAQLRFPLICLGVGFLAIVVIFHPYITRNTHDTAAVKHDDGRLTQVEELFSVSTVFALLLGNPGNTGQYLFPGILAAFLGLLFFITHLPRRKPAAAGILFFSLLLMCYLVYADRTLLNPVFLVFLLFLAYLLAVGWKEIEAWTKLPVLLFAFMFLFLFHFTFPGFLKSLSLYRLFYLLLPVGGLTVIKRTFLMLLPFFIVMAAIGAQRFFPRVETLKPYKRYILFSLLLAVLAAENIRNPMLYLENKNGVMKPLPPVEKVYERLPFRSGKVVLEVPFYVRRRAKNSYYMLNWRFHRNPLLNGEVTLFSKEYYTRLSSVIGKYQRDFPTAEGLTRLLRDYSVSYIVIHWDLLAEYQGTRRSPVSRQDVLRRIVHLGRYLEIIDDAPGHTVLKLRENFPLKEIIRTYSYYHLKNNKVKISLKEKYSGVVRVFLNGRPHKTLNIRDSVVEVNFEGAPLSYSGNGVRFQFDSEITLHDIALI